MFSKTQKSGVKVSARGTGAQVWDMYCAQSISHRQVAESEVTMDICGCSASDGDAELEYGLLLLNRR